MAQLLKTPPAMQETWVWSLSWEDSPGEGKGYPLQYAGPESSMDCTVHGVTKSWKRLSDFHFQLKHPGLSCSRWSVTQISDTVVSLKSSFGLLGSKHWLTTGCTQDTVLSAKGHKVEDSIVEQFRAPRRRNRPVHNSGPEWETAGEASARQTPTQLKRSKCLPAC